MLQTLPYQYLPLSDESTDYTVSEPSAIDDDQRPLRIRLLTVQPGTFDDEIEVDLEMVWLDPSQPCQYEALSYVWGTSEILDTVYVGRGKKHTLRAGRNLSTALRYLRYPNGRRIVWVDALCINQSDLSERGVQVANMGKIYRLANRVVAWLGPEENDSNLTLELLDSLGSKLDIDPITRAMKPSTEGLSDAHLADRNHRLQINARELSALQHIFNRAWFDRLWIRQEIYLGYARAIVQAGFKTASWRNFSLAALRVLRNEWGNEVPDVEEAILKRLTWLQELFYHDSVLLESIRRTCGRCRCSDQRDRVYAVMNMLPNYQKQFIGVPDYSLPPMEVWKRAVLSYIRHHQIAGPQCLSLLILDECVGEEPFDTPTWVPKWEVEDATDSTRTFTFLGMSGSLMTPFVEHLEEDILRVLGVGVQVVQSVTRVPDSKSLISSVKQFVNSIDLDQPYPGRGTYLNACVYTFLGGQIQESTSPPRDDKPTELEISQSIQELIATKDDDYDAWSLINTTSSKFRAIASDCLVGRCLITTRDGYIGVAPKSVKAGDRVVVFAGGYSPVVLRPSENGRPQHHLIGSCYLEGFMWLEAFLGPLPQNYRYVARQMPGENYVSFETFNSETGSFRADDPRVEPWSIAGEYLKACKADEFYTIDIDTEIGKKMAINVEYFDII